MALNETAEVTRSAIKAGGVLFVIILISWTLWQRAIKPWLISVQKPNEPIPTLGFGALPPLVFPTSGASDLEFQLDTIGDSLTSWGPLAQVYLYSFSRPSLLNLETATKQAAAMGFTLEPDQITTNTYRWSRNTGLPAIFDMDIVTQHFRYDLGWETDPSFLSNQATPDEQAMVTQAKNFLNKGQFLPADMKDGLVKVSYLDYNSGLYTKTINYEADFVQVDLFRAPIKAPARLVANPNVKQEMASILPADPNKGLASLIMTTSKPSKDQVISADYTYTQILYEQTHTYPIITGPEAWDALLDGRGYIATSITSDTAIIRSVSIGYFEALDNQKYLQPIYIFEGDDDFTAYVPAIRAEYLTQ